MTLYDPNPTITVDGVALNDEVVINRININYGRNDIFSQPQPGFASFELWTNADISIDVELSDPITIDVQAATTGTKRLFTGTISDIQISLGGFGSDGGYAIYKVTALGPLALLNKRTAGSGGYAKQFDGDRIYDICYEAFVTTWSELSSTAWDALPISGTWDTFEAASITLIDDLATDIDQPGQYELHAYSDGITNALDLAQFAAQSGRGILYEQGDGSIHYDDFLKRQTYTPISLGADEILVDGLATDAQWSEIVNDATVSYKANAEQNWRDEQSVQLYGELVGSRSTQLENLTDAYNQAFAFVEARSYPRTYPATISVALHSPTVTDVKRDELLGVFCGTALNVTELPGVFGILFDGYVENYTWIIKEKEAYLTMGNSSLKESYPSIIWLQVTPPTVTWATYPATVRWNEV